MNLTIDKFIKKPDGSYLKGCIECNAKRNSRRIASTEKRLAYNSN